MTVVLHVLLFLHLLGWAIVFGSVLAGLRGPSLYAGAFHGALTALITGVLMVLVIEVWLKSTPSLNPTWVAVKLAIGLVVAGLVWLGRARPARVNRGLLVTIAALTVVNVGVATIFS
jgi:hypothetical protein